MKNKIKTFIKKHKVALVSAGIITTVGLGYTYIDIKLRQDEYETRLLKKDVTCEGLLDEGLLTGDVDTYIDHVARVAVSGHSYVKLNDYDKFAARVAIKWSLKDACFGGF